MVEPESSRAAPKLPTKKHTCPRYPEKPRWSVNYAAYSLKDEGDADCPNQVRLLSMKQVILRPHPKHHKSRPISSKMQSCQGKRIHLL